MKINNLQEKNDFLKQNIKNIGSYALVTYDNHTEAIWISKFEKFINNEDYFLEAPCVLHEYQINLNDMKNMNLFDEEEGWFVRDNKTCEIDCPQTGPFLPDILDDLVLISEEECLDWILEQMD